MLVFFSFPVELKVAAAASANVSWPKMVMFSWVATKTHFGNLKP